MSSEPTESSTETEPEQHTESGADTASQPQSGSQPLTITLPDGSESVSDAILSHREMLRAPDDHGLATTQEITHLSEAMEALSADVEAATDEEQHQADVTELQTAIEQQQQQIAELRSAVTSLAEILGAEVEWDEAEQH
jgi:peptidoglycan hydrolase CwlO-like protein